MEFGCSTKLQIDADGDLIAEENQEYVWLEEAFTDNYANISLSQLVPKVITPLKNDIFSKYENCCDNLSVNSL